MPDLANIDSMIEESRQRIVRALILLGLDADNETLRRYKATGEGFEDLCALLDREW